MHFSKSIILINCCLCKSVFPFEDGAPPPENKSWIWDPLPMFVDDKVEVMMK